MNIVRSTVKGQVLIPADIRRKFNIVKGTSMAVSNDDEKIILEPLKADSILEGRGMLKSKGRILKALVSDRKKESLL
jgi:AbrB family looped-hinge helix DNA binding protein